MSASTRNVRISVLAGIAAMSLLVIVTLVLLSSGRTAHAVTGTTDPQTGLIKQVAIDMDTTGNTPGTGTTGATVTLLSAVDPVAANVPLNTTHNIDVIVDEVASADGNATGFGFNLHYNPAIVTINDGASTPAGAHNEAFMVSSGFEPGTVSDPDNSGDWRVDYLTLGAGTHKGEGVLVRITLLCGNVVGSSTLTIDDETNNGPGSQPVVFTHTNTNGDPTVEMPVNDWTGRSGGSLTANIFCGEGTPAPNGDPVAITNSNALTHTDSFADTYAVADAVAFSITNAGADERAVRRQQGFLR